MTKHHKPHSKSRRAASGAGNKCDTVPHNSKYTDGGSNTSSKNYSSGAVAANKNRRRSNDLHPKRHRNRNRTPSPTASKSKDSWLSRLLGGVIRKPTNHAAGAIGSSRATRRKPKARGLFAKFKTKPAAVNPRKNNSRRHKPRGQKYDSLAELCPTAIGMDIVLPTCSGDKLPLVISRQDHKYSRRFVSSAALKVLKKLHSAGFAAYLVGGGVRDVLLGKVPKDFDIATDAHPEQIQPLFQRCRIIGRRFRLVHVYFRGEIIEVSTFRAGVTDNGDSEESGISMLAHDNVYGTIEEDAWRRDFTINALYYNIADNSLVDYTGGLLDLQKRQLRVIGDPEHRFHEDPVRMLRAIRMAAKLDFQLEEKAEQSLVKMARLLEHVPAARLFDEIVKLLFNGHAQESYNLLDKWGYLKVLFPNATAVAMELDDPRIMNLIQQAVIATDKRFAAKQSLNPGFLLSVLFWPILAKKLSDQVMWRKNKKINTNYKKENISGESLLQVDEHTWKDLVGNTIYREIGLKIPRRLQDMVRSIWDLQWLLERRKATQVKLVIQSRYFRAAVDFMALRAEVGYDLEEQNSWWWDMRQSTVKQVQQKIDAMPESRKKPRRQKYQRRRKQHKSRVSNTKEN